MRWRFGFQSGRRILYWHKTARAQVLQVDPTSGKGCLAVVRRALGARWFHQKRLLMSLLVELREACLDDLRLTATEAGFALFQKSLAAFLKVFGAVEKSLHVSFHAQDLVKRQRASRKYGFHQAVCQGGDL